MATLRAQGDFDVKLTPQTPDPGDDSALGRLAIDKVFHNDLAATSRGHMLAAGAAVEGSAAYSALERVTGTLRGVAGSFVLQHTGIMNRGAPSLTITVVPDSGTGALAGLRGSMDIIIEGGRHSYVFDYEVVPGA